MRRNPIFPRPSPFEADSEAEMHFTEDRYAKEPYAKEQLERMREYARSKYDLHLRYFEN